jgi:hypothetical protein
VGAVTALVTAPASPPPCDQTPAGETGYCDSTLCQARYGSSIGMLSVSGAGRKSSSTHISSKASGIRSR